MTSRPPRSGEALIRVRSLSFLMAPSPSPPNPLEDRLRLLEEEVARLKERVLDLEGRLGRSPEHPVDQQMVRSKVAFDWQT